MGIQLSAAQCPRCRANYGRNKKNTIVFIHTSQPWFDHLLSCCHKCGVHVVHFLPPSVAAEVIDEGYPLHEQAFAEDDIIEMYMEDHPLVRRRTLTARLERLCADFKRVLERMPDRDLIAELSLPQPARKYPEVWT